jgi:hypothetical protein
MNQLYHHNQIFTLQPHLREAAVRICGEDRAVRAMGFIIVLAEACFVQGLINVSIQTCWH